MNLSKPKIESIKEYFKAKPVLKAYLFGSYVRGEADSQSDIDLVVELDYSKKIGLQFVQMKLDLEQLLQAKVDLVSSSAVSKHLNAVIDKEKQLIYAR
jgi:predicted nucleotidyltransferase